MPDAHLRGQHWGATQRVGGGGQALHTRARGVLEEEGGLGGLAWRGREGGCVTVPNAYWCGDGRRLMQRVHGGDQALCAGSGEIREQEGGLSGMAGRGGGPGCIAVPDAHRWGDLRRIMLGGLVLSIQCVWEEGDGVKLGVAGR